MKPEIVTPLMYIEALGLADDAVSIKSGATAFICTDLHERVAKALMAMDVASREQERDRAALIVEQEVDGDDDPTAPTLRRLAAAIRDPETISESTKAEVTS